MGGVGRVVLGAVDDLARPLMASPVLAAVVAIGVVAVALVVAFASRRRRKY